MFVTVAVRAGALSASFLFTVVVARTLTLRDAGVFLTAVLVASAIATIARLGTDVQALRDAVPRSTASYRGGMIPRPRYRYLTRVCLLGSAVATLLSLLGVTIIFAGTEDFWPIVTVMLSLPAQALSILDSALIRASGSRSVGTVFEVGLTQAIGIVVLLALNAWSACTLQTTAAAYLAAQVINSAAARYLTYRRSVAPIDERSSLQLQDSFFIASNGVASYLLIWSPAMVAVWTFGAEEAALVVATLRYANLLSIPSAILSTAYLPEAASEWREGSQRAIQTLTTRYCILLLGSVGALTAGLFVLAPALMQAYGADYSDAHLLLRILALGAAFPAYCSLAGSLLAILGFSKSTNAMTAAVATTTFASGYAASLLGDLTIVALVSSIGQALLGAYFIVTLRRLTSIRLSPWAPRT